MKRTFLAGILAAALLAPALEAQTSRTNAATLGLFGNDVDNYMDVNEYQDVEFDKFFGYLGGGGTGTPGWIAGGLAKQFGSFYTGLYYEGTLLRVNNSENTDFNGDLVQKQTDYLFGDNIFFLLGTPVGGFKLFLGINPRLQKDDQPGTSNITNNTGDFGVGLTWGKNFALGSGLLKPEVELGFDMSTRKHVVEDLSVNPSTEYTEKIDPSSFWIRLAGDYEFPQNGSAQSVLTVSDRFTYFFYSDPMYDNTVAGSNTYTQGYTQKRDNGFFTNGLEASFKRTYEIDDRFSVAWRAGGSFTLGIDNTDTTVSVGGSSTSVKGTTTTTIILTPNAQLGFTYAFIPDKFTLKGAAGVSATYTHQSRKDNTSGSSAETKANVFSGLSPSAGLGGTLQFHPMAAFDFAVGTGFAGGRFNVNATSISLGVIIRN